MLLPAVMAAFVVVDTRGVRSGRSVHEQLDHHEADDWALGTSSCGVADDYVTPGRGVDSPPCRRRVPTPAPTGASDRPYGLPVQRRDDPAGIACLMPEGGFGVFLERTAAARDKARGPMGSGVSGGSVHPLGTTTVAAPRLATPHQRHRTWLFVTDGFLSSTAPANQQTPSGSRPDRSDGARTAPRDHDARLVPERLGSARC